MSFRSRLYALLAVATVASVAYVVPRRHAKQPVTQQESGAGYVNPALCAVCHEGISKTYRLTGMGRSFYRPRAENTIEDYQSRNKIYNRASDRYYTMTQRDGRPYQRRHQIGFGG